MAYLFEGYQCDWIIFCQVIDPSLTSRQVLPDAPCSNEIFIDLAFEGIQRAFGEAADVALNVKRFGWESDVYFFSWLVSNFSWFMMCPLSSYSSCPEVETHWTHSGRLWQVIFSTFVGDWGIGVLIRRYLSPLIIAA